MPISNTSALNGTTVAARNEPMKSPKYPKSSSQPINSKCRIQNAKLKIIFQYVPSKGLKSRDLLFGLQFVVDSGKLFAKMKKFFAYFIPIVLAFAVGALGSYVQGEALREWYPHLVKSPATPPAVVFPIAWSILYLLIAISAGTMLVRGDMSVLRLWLLQLLLNFLWSVCFFALRSPFAGLLVILALDVTVFAYIVYAASRRAVAAWLFVPYLLWLVFATYLNGYIYMNNRKSEVMAVVSCNVVNCASLRALGAGDGEAESFS
jgi:tryptophan-rich sensory protein